MPSAPASRYEAILEAAAAARADGVPGLAGVHLEGPFLSAARRGAHPEELLLAPDPAWLGRLCDRHPGLVRMVTLAPELPGALEVAAACRERGVRVAVGHSVASVEQVAAIEPDMVTHLFNAMGPLHHRTPGLVGWALSEPVVCGLIADGVHVHPRVVRLAFAAKGPHFIALVSDASAGGPGLSLSDGAWRLPDGTLAGGAVHLDSALEVCVQAGVARADAVTAATDTPGRLLGPAPGGRDGLL